MAWTTPGTATAGEVLTAAFWNANVRDNLNELSDLGEGWTSYTPALTGMTGATINFAKYKSAGKMVILTVAITMGTVTGSLGVALPTNAAAIGAGFPVLCTALAADVGTNNYPLTALFLLAGRVDFHAQVANGTYVNYGTSPTSATVPFTWAAGDILSFTAIYETA